MSLLTRIRTALSPGFMLPWSADSNLQALVWRDIAGADDADIVTRGVAMRCAPVKRARAVIIGRLADLPLELGSYDPASGEFMADEVQPEWLGVTDDEITTPWSRIAHTLDDLLFYGWSLWTVERDTARAVVSADRLEIERWRFDPTSPTGVSIALGDPGAELWSHVLDSTTVLLFTGADDGLLENAADTIRGWRHMERSWVGRVRNPLPLLALKQLEPNGIGEAAARAHVAAWSEARMSPTGAVGWLPYGMGIEVLGTVEADLFDKGRNAARIDFANHTNLPVSYLDGSVAVASLTYTTQEGTRAQIIDDLEYWLAPVEARLSELDVAGAGKVLRFNRSNLTATPNDDHGPERDDRTRPALEGTPVTRELEG